MIVNVQLARVAQGKAALKIYEVINILATKSGETDQLSRIRRMRARDEAGNLSRTRRQHLRAYDPETLLELSGSVSNFESCFALLLFALFSDYSSRYA